MRRTHTTSRRGGLITASAALVCLGGPALTACGAGQDDGYVAVGSAAGSEHSTEAERPKGEVSLVPLPGQSRGERASGTPDSTRKRGSEKSGEKGEKKASEPEASSGASSEAPRRPSSGTEHPAEPGGPDDSGKPPGSQGPGSADPGPAALKTGKPERAKGEDRWCEKVTVTFRNAGGRPVDSGTVTFGTHVIDALGTDWATRESTRKLPVPIAPGKKKEKTWTVCLDAWRVPLGMHVETRDVKVSGWR
ncbi:hypothetical protein [Streptomyces sp. NPDC048172]|uniref:hypothetical protein n=1 Tax=Streptomyces sp. NPDC048172 TaxID=3365505 RepID=UPI003717B0B6